MDNPEKLATLRAQDTRWSQSKQKTQHVLNTTMRVHLSLLYVKNVVYKLFFSRTSFGKID